MKTEETLAKQIIIVQKEFQDIVTYLDEGRPARAGAIIGSRRQIISEKLKELNKDKKFKERLERYTEELNQEQEKAIKEKQEIDEKFRKRIDKLTKGNPAGYMG